MWPMGLLFVNKSLIVNPLSAIISSPSSINSRKFECSVIYLSETLPPYTSETKVNVPEGEIPSKHFPVFRDL